MKKWLLAIAIVLTALFIAYIYWDYHIIVLITFSWKKFLFFSKSIYKALLSWIVKHTPAFAKNLLTKRLWKPFWSFLSITFLSFLGPKIVFQINKTKQEVKNRLIKLKNYWDNLNLLKKVIILLVFGIVLYVLGLGILVPLVGMSFLGKIIKKGWLSFTNWLISRKEEELRKKAVRRLRERSKSFKETHDLARRIKIGYIKAVRKSRRRWKNGTDPNT